MASWEQIDEISSAKKPAYAFSLRITPSFICVTEFCSGYWWMDYVTEYSACYDYTIQY